ncbi:MAG: hypothetical protein LBR67_03645 [Dysgonamonadaceae bacterium]|jgi:aspartyl-tRNA(Asn)/glutamyl-tRNA(Gln) amidotransferase subunit A|nr:hypothetical protein [Dysgonamonadaceae bacterium]
MESEIHQIHRELVAGNRSCCDIIKDKINLLRSNEYQSVNLILEDEALALAEKVDAKISRGESIGLLEGIPFGIKDVILLQQQTATGSSAFLRNYTAPYTATAIRKLVDAGAIPVVKENCDCFGHGSTSENTVFGAVKNAHDKKKVGGGSSGGSAVNVAKNYTAFSIGGDTGGSIRQPAGYNRIYGLKPTYGRVSRYGLMAYSSSTDCLGPLASSLEDIRIVLNTMGGKDPKDQTTYHSQPIPETVFTDEFPKKGFTVGYYKSFLENELLDKSICNDFQAMIDLLSAQGLTVRPLDFFDTNVLVSTYYVLAMAETASNLARLDGSVFGARSNNKSLKDGYLLTRSENLTDETKRRIIGGNQVLSHGREEEIYLKARILRKSIIDNFNQDFKNVDIILSPVSTTLPPEIGLNLEDPFAMYLSDAFTVGFSLGGLPTLTAPLFTPTGIQITADKNKEGIILKVANYLKHLQ